MMVISNILFKRKFIKKEKLIYNDMTFNNPHDDYSINCDDINEADGIILSAGYGRSYSYRGGAEFGPVKTIDALEEHLESFDRFTLSVPSTQLKIAHHELTDLNLNTSKEMVTRISSFFEQNGTKFILMIGGDHSVSIGAFDGLSKIYNSSDVTIVQIDAHPDMRDDESDHKENGHDKFTHSSTMRRGVEMGYKTIQVGIRTISIHDHNFIAENKLKVFEWGREQTPSVEEIINSIATEKVYLTIDLDGIDPAHTPGTGTPVPGGLEWNYTLKLIRELISAKDIIGADIVEIAPTEDDVLTPYAAAHLCYNIYSYVLLKNKGLLKFYN
jgi:agmatinase